MKVDFLVLGGFGMQGRIAARDLMESGYSVCMADRTNFGKEEFLTKFPHAIAEKVDAENLAQVTELIKKLGNPVVLNCSEGDWNVNVYKACLEAGTHVLDLGSDIPMTKDQYAMDADFKARNLAAITGCGSAPGINNVMLAHIENEFDSISTIQSGFAWTSNIKKFVVPFSMPSIMEEFTDPAAIVENGTFIERTPLQTVTDYKFNVAGPQKCFFVRHPETLTFYEDMKHKGVKNVYFYAGFPEHSFEPINTLIDLGFDSEEEIIVEGVQTTPVDMMTNVLKRLPKPEGYTEVENIWLLVEGTKSGAPLRVQMEMIAPTLPGWEDAACNIDTGMPASIMAQMVKDGRVTKRGSMNPTTAVPPLPFFEELKKRGMLVYKNGAQVGVGERTTVIA